MPTGISWCDETINPIVGCSKASAGCNNCYAQGMARRLAAMGTAGYGEVISAGRWNGKTAFVPSALDKPYHWHKPRTIFIGSMGDVFHESVDALWLNAVMKMVALNGQHTFILLTKRARRMQEYMARTIDQPLHNLVLGVSVEDQAMADERIPLLLATPAAKRFISLEPMIGPVDLAPYLHGGLFADPSEIGKFFSPLDGVILGGESGNGGRRLDPLWVIQVRDQCAKAGVPFMFKQWSHENRNEVDHVSGFPLLQDDRTHTALAWSVR